MKKTNNLLWISLIICFGCCVQLLFMFFFMNPKTLEWPDSRHYLSIANTLLNGDSYSSDIDNLYRSPGYPYFLYFLIGILGNNVIVLRLAHVALHIIFLIGVYLLGKEWKGEKFGLLITFVCCLYPYYIYIPLSFVPETLLILFSSWIIWLFLRINRTYNNYALAGACIIISMGALTRPTYIIISIAFFASLFLTDTSSLNKLKAFIFLIIVPITLLSLWGYRNLKMHDHFIISTAANINLFMGFNENTTVYTKIDCLVPVKVQTQLSVAKDVFERDSIYKSSAIGFIKQHPIKSLYLASVRMLDLWNPLPHTTTNYSQSRKIIAAIPYSIVLIFSVWGFYLLRKERFVYLLLGILILNTGVNGIFAVSVRYRVIFDIIIILFFTFFLFTKSNQIQKKLCHID